MLNTAPDQACGCVPAQTVLGIDHSLNGRRWIWRRGEDRTAFAIAQRLDLPEILGQLLAARGIGLDDAADFLDPTLRALMPDPALLVDMDQAARRLAQAVQKGETVAVFGDYDVDGACSAALMTLFLGQLGCPILPYVPDRLREGYGPNGPALEGLVERGATLIVCVDCGTAAHEALQAVHGRADVVVLDHHKAEGVPPILATVNPNRTDCGSGLHGLCAAAVAFMAAVATVRALRKAGAFATRPEPDLRGLLDLVALATVCDVMPLTGLNRALVTQGLKIMGQRQRPGLAALLEVAQAKDRPSAFTCGFALGPRINAAGRISESDLGLRLLTCDDTVEAQRLAAILDGVNRQRQDVEAGMLDAAILQAEQQLAQGHATLVIGGEGWHPGVVGIVAGRLKERFNRPACVAGQADGVLKGSGRSVTGLDLGAAIIAARQAGLLLTGGGHAMAAGFSLRPEQLSAFHAFVDERLAQAATLPGAADLPIEASLNVDAATTELAHQVARLAPFGNGNPEPVFVLPRVRVLRAERIGKEGNTVRAWVEGEGGLSRIKALLFRGKDNPVAEALLARNGLLHLAGHLRAEEWNGRETTSFFISDAAMAS